MSQRERTMFVGNLHPDVSEQILWDIATQMGPVDNVSIVEPSEAAPVEKNENTNKVEPYRYGFVIFEDECSVLFACQMLQDVELFNKKLSLKPRSETRNYQLWCDQRKKESPRNQSKAVYVPTQHYALADYQDKREEVHHLDGWEASNRNFGGQERNWRYQWEEPSWYERNPRNRNSHRNSHEVYENAPGFAGTWMNDSSMYVQNIHNPFRPTSWLLDSGSQNFRGNHRSLYNTPTPGYKRTYHTADSAPKTFNGTSSDYNSFNRNRRQYR